MPSDLLSVPTNKASTEGFSLIRSGRKTLALSVQQDGSVLVRAPYQMPQADIRAFVMQQEGWIKKHRALQAKRQTDIANNAGEKFTPDDIYALAQEAKQILPARVQHFAALLKVTYGRVTIRNQLTRWGSCSGKGNLNFNCLLVKTPPETLDYVVVHELCHRKQMNHSPAFWALVQSVLPDYQKQRQWLKDSGRFLIERMRR